MTAPEFPQRREDNVTARKLNGLTRRSILAGGAAASVVAAAASREAAAQGAKRPVVLVHGAWHGAWCYQRVVPILTAAGHRVHAPTLTGLADRSHLLSRDVNLETHAKDVANLILWEDLQDAVLVGHSYGGAVISAAIELVASRIAATLFLDAFLPRSGDSIVGTGQDPRDGGERCRGHPAHSRPAFAVNERDQAWVDAKCTPQSLQTFLDRPVLAGARERMRRKVYVRAERYTAPTFDTVLERVRADASWTTYRLPCGHDMMIDLPQQTADLILEAAA